ncbi:N-acetyltransferase domain-containing protein [Mycena chlorophos]|uniref:N-acetyltransferase domain-containing protein n=1 Tax=Mycena chlorophos TaxID=658473 RepID=A0A8H6WJK1_MYCCL|nr:N-acetyltransferase domain-containing protein [Mycena chlorophos]
MADPSAHLPDRFLVASAELREKVAAETPIRFTDEGEPYLALPTPFERFYLGPERHSDLPFDVAMMSDIRVAGTIVGPPFPNTFLGAQKWLLREREFAEKLFAGYADGLFRPTAADSNPFSVLRERKGDGEPDVYVGQVSCSFREGPGAMLKRPVREGIESWRKTESVCEIGAALNFDYHGKGIASVATKVVFDFAVEQMGATEIHAELLLKNPASARVWQKLGLIEDESLRTQITMPEVKGGQVETSCVYIWYLQ